MRKKICCSFILLLVVYGCRQTLYMPAEHDSAKQEQLMTGRKLYVEHCSSCHNLHLPKEYNREQWRFQLDEMQAKAKISDAEKKLIYDYLIAGL